MIYTEDQLLAAEWRVGRKLGRTLYAELGPRPDQDHVLIGMLDSELLARAACEAHNAWLAGGAS